MRRLAELGQRKLCHHPFWRKPGVHCNKGIDQTLDTRSVFASSNTRLIVVTAAPLTFMATLVGNFCLQVLIGPAGINNDKGTILVWT